MGMNDLPAALLREICGRATKSTLRAIGGTCQALLLEARAAVRGGLLYNVGAAATSESDEGGSSTEIVETLHGSTTFLYDRVPGLEHGPDTLAICGANVYQCVHLPDGTICFSIPENRSLLRVDCEGNALGVLSFEAIWPRELAVSSAGVCFTTMPPDVNSEEAPDYPSTRVVRVPLRRLLQASVDAPVACTDFVLLQWYAGEEDEEGLCDANLRFLGSPIAIGAEGSRTFVLHRIIQVGARPDEYRDDEYLYGFNPFGGGGDRTNRAAPRREAFITVFDHSAVRPIATFSLGEHPAGEAPEQVVPFRGLLYINCSQHVLVFDARGNALRDFRVSCRPFSDFANSIAIFNDRLYARSFDCVSVCDLDGALLQAVKSPIPSIEGMLAGGSMVGLSVNKQHAVFIMQLNYRRPGQRPRRFKGGPADQIAIRVLGVRGLHHEI